MLKHQRKNTNMAQNPTCVDCVLDLINGLPFKLVVSKIRTNNLGEWISIRVGLELIQTFLTFVPEWRDTNKVVRDPIGDLVRSIEDAFETAGHDIADAVEKGDAELLDAVCLNLREKSELLKPRIGAAYDFFSEHAFLITAPHPPITNSEVWGRFCGLVLSNASSLTDASRLSIPMLLQIKNIVSSLQAFGEVYLTRASNCKPFRSLGFHLEGVAISLARLLFSWWVGETNEHDKAVMLKTVMQGGLIMSQPFSGESSGTGGVTIRQSVSAGSNTVKIEKNLVTPLIELEPIISHIPSEAIPNMQASSSMSASQDMLSIAASCRGQLIHGMLYSIPDAQTTLSLGQSIDAAVAHISPRTSFPSSTSNLSQWRTVPSMSHGGVGKWQTVPSMSQRGVSMWQIDPSMSQGNMFQVQPGMQPIISLSQQTSNILRSAKSDVTVRKLTDLGTIPSRSKMGLNHACVDYALEIIMEEPTLHLEYMWFPVIEGLELIQTFLIFAPNWSKNDKIVGEHLGALVSSIRDAFDTAGLDIGNAIKKRHAEGLDAVRSNLVDKIEILKPRMREAYDFLSDYAFRITSPRPPPITDPKVWSLFCGLLVSNAMRICKWSHDNPFFKEYPSIVRTLQCFGLAYLDHTSDGKQLRGLGILMEGAAICLARLIFLSWIQEVDEKDAIIIILNMLQKIKPTSQKILEMYMQVLGTTPKDEDLNQLVGIIFPPCQTSLWAMRNGMQSLIEYLLDPYSREQSENVQALRSDIEKVVIDAASLAHISDELELFHLLQNIELLRVELALTNSIRGCNTISTRTFESIYAGLNSLQAFLIRPLGFYSQELMLIFKRIEQVVRQAECLHLQVNKGKHSNALGCKLFLDFRLVKIQAFMMEQMRCCPSLMVLVKKKFVALNEGLELLYKHCSVLPTENQDDKELILSIIKRLPKEETLQLPKHIINKMSFFDSSLLPKVNRLNTEIKDAVLLLRTSSVATFPKTTHQGLGFVNVFFEKLSALVFYKADIIGFQMKHQIEAVLNELDSLRSLLVLMEFGEKRNHDPSWDYLQRGVAREAYKADYIIDWILLVRCDWSHMLWLSDVINDMKLLKPELAKLVQRKNDLSQVHGNVPALKEIAKHASAPEVGEAVIALVDQENVIIDRLTRGKSQREVVTISGMPGIGKTTLASRVYENTRVKSHFRGLAWCCVSQVYRRREVLLKIIRDIAKISTDEMSKKTDEDLMEILCKGLKGIKYCVVMDDVWSNQMWEELGIAFPDDKNGSRILITTRNQEVGLKAEDNSAPHILRSLTKDESWKLLQRKVFDKDSCPLELQDLGLTIAEGCKGLPLSIVAIAGVLKTIEGKADWWKQIKKDLNSFIFENSETQCMHILELSYNHLPDWLKPCFLYLAAFGEDVEVSVQKLIQLWIAEGFITRVHDQEPSLEDVAESYVMDLIGRSLLMATKKGSSGRVKACKVHDMLHKLCLRKVEEEHFLQYINGYEKIFPSNMQLDYGVDLDHSPISVAYEHHRLSICSKRKHFVMLKPSGPSVRTLLFSAMSDTHPRCPYDEISFIIEKFKILSILDIESINIGSCFPKGILLLYPLRYLAISGDIRSIPSTIANLWNLETFIVKGLIGKVALPDTLWSMSRLRHLHVTTQAILNLLGESVESSSQLDNMVSLSCPALFHGDNTVKMMKLFPKLRKLKCTFSELAQQSEESISFPILDFLVELESLKIIYFSRERRYCELKGVSFPLNLKHLSLSDFRLTWDAFSAIGELPNLKILKLVSIAFDSSIWKMKNGEFQQLEYLKLDSLKIAEWNADSGHLPHLQQLVLQSCVELEEVPSSFGEICTLQMIELKWCSVSPEKSVVAIVEQQLEYGNKGFKAFINGLAANPGSSLDD